MSCRCFAGATTGELGLGTDVYATAQKCPGRDNNAARAEAPSFQRLHAKDRLSTFVDDKTRDGALNRSQARVLLEKMSDRTSIETAIALRSGRPDRWPLTAIQHAKLQHGKIGGLGHDAAQRIYFADYRTLGHSADCGVTRHLANGLERARNDRDASSDPSSSDSGFGAGVASTDDDDIELSFVRS
jgi:hypothetical protein